MKKLLILLALFALLSGCASYVDTNVTAFHDLGRPVSGATYAVVPYEKQIGDLEFETYAKLAKAELNKLGMVETPLQKAKYGVFMLYGIDDGQQVASSYPIIGQTGVASSNTTGNMVSLGNTAYYSGRTYNTPTYGVVGSGTRIDVAYKRSVDVCIVEVAKSTASHVQIVYKANAFSYGSTGQLSKVMPAIVKGVFEDFPGKSGEVRVSRQTLEE